MKKNSLKLLTLLGTILYLSALFLPKEFLSTIFEPSSWGAVVTLLLLPLLGVLMIVISVKQRTYAGILIGLIFIFSFFITMYLIGLIKTLS